MQLISTPHPRNSEHLTASRLRGPNSITQFWFTICGGQTPTQLNGRKKIWPLSTATKKATPTELHTKQWQIVMETQQQLPQYYLSGWPATQRLGQTA